MKNWRANLFLYTMLSLFFSTSLIAATTGSITGSVRDAEKHATVPGVTVIAKSAGGEKVELTDENGVFTIGDLAAGSYTVFATFGGASDQKTVNVEAGKATQVQFDLKMSMAKVEQYNIEVTGSLLGATAKDTPIPLLGIDREETQKRGDPTVLQQIKALPISGPVFGDANPFNPDAQFRPGAGTINVRGLGAQRTLVLLNGHRFSPNNITAPDTNLLPSSIIGRVEILKDGGATTYGSDAVAGVANFFTRQDINGFEFSADYRQITGSAGDANLSGAYGRSWNSGNFLVSAAYQFRGELMTTERAWAFQPRLTNPLSYSPFNNPGLWTVFGDIGNGEQVIGGGPDANCVQMGGDIAFFANTPLCWSPFAPYFSLVNEQHQVQLYGEFNTKVGSSSKFHLDALYAMTNQPNILVVPSFPTLNGPDGPGTGYFVPKENPGFNDFLTQTGQGALIPVASGARTAGPFGIWSPFSLGGNPTGDIAKGFGGTRAYNKNEEIRVSGDLSGDIGILDLHYKLGSTYIIEEQLGSFKDLLVWKLQAALKGFGGPDCAGEGTGGVAGEDGCEYFNPFSNAIAGNARSGVANPGFIPANANDSDLVKWMYDDPRELRNRTDLAVFDALIDGNIPIHFKGGKPTWGIGGQFRRTTVVTTIDDDLLNALVTPCPTPGDTDCEVKSGPYVFSGQYTPRYVDQGVYALFGQLDMPFFDSLKSSFSLRFEDYGGLTGSTIDPQFRAKWQIADFIALRGSIGTAFRGPTPYNKVPDRVVTQLASLEAAGGIFVANDQFGNPNLKAEKAFTFNVGTLLSGGGFTGTFDFWFYKLDNPIAYVPQDLIGNAMLNAFGFANCTSPLRDRVTFGSNDVCTPGTTSGHDITRVRSDAVNGPTITTMGVDADLGYRWKNMFGGGGTLDLGALASIVIKYEQDKFVLEGVTVAESYDAVGYTNYNRLPGTIPRWRGQFFANYNHGWHNFRVSTTYVDGATDHRGPVAVQTGPTTAPFAPIGLPDLGKLCTVANVNAGTAVNCQISNYGTSLSGFVSLDATYQLSLPWDMVVSVTGTNLIGMDPPTSRLVFGYDPFIGNPLGRTFKFAITQKF